MELEKELGKDKAHLILKETLLEGLKSEQFDLDHLKREAQSHETQLKEETRNQLVDQMKGTVPLQEKGKSSIDKNQILDSLKVGRRESTDKGLNVSEGQTLPPELKVETSQRIGLPAHPAVTKDKFIKGHPVPKEAELPAKELSPQELTAANEERFKNIYRKLENDERLSEEDLKFFRQAVQDQRYHRAMERLSVHVHPKRPNGLPPHPRVYKNKVLYNKARLSHLKDDMPRSRQSSDNIEIASIMEEIAPSKHLPYPVSPNEKPPKQRDKKKQRDSILPYPDSDPENCKVIF
jgi:hypothetical protein